LYSQRGGIMPPNLALGMMMVMDAILNRRGFVIHGLGSAGWIMTGAGAFVPLTPAIAQLAEKLEIVNLLPGEAIPNDYEDVMTQKERNESLRVCAGPRARANCKPILAGELSPKRSLFTTWSLFLVSNLLGSVLLVQRKSSRCTTAI
jgi:hypothetical protein